MSFAKDNPRLSFRVVARGGALITAGTLLGHLAGVVSAPLLTRLYTPGDVGIFASFVALLAVAAVVVSLGYEAAIPLERSAERARGVARLALMLAGGSTLMLVALSVSVTTVFGAIYWFDIRLAMWFALGVLITGAFQIGNAWRLQRQQFGVASVGRAAQGVGAALFQVLAGLASAGAAGLVAGQVFGLAVAALAVTWGLLKSKRSLSTSLAGLIALARKHREFPKYMTPALLINILSQHSPVLVIGMLTSVEVVGHYALSYRILTGPALLLGHSIGQSFYSQVTRRGVDHAALVSQTTSAIYGLGLPFFVWIMAVGPVLFEFLFGEAWMKAGEYARYMAPWLAINLASATISQYVFVAKRQRAALRFAIGATVIRLGALVIGAVSGSITILLIAFSLAATAVSVAFAVWVFALAGVDLRSWVRQNLRPSAIGVSLLGGAYLASMFVSPAVQVALVTGGCLTWTIFELKAVRSGLGSDNLSSN